MLPDRLRFLERFDRFYQVTVNSVKEDKIREKDFYLIIGAKVRSMDRARKAIKETKATENRQKGMAENSTNST